MAGDGTEPRRISKFGSGYPGMPSDPVFSPDGARLVVSMTPVRRSRDADLYMMNIDGTGLANLTELFAGTQADGLRDLMADG